jgi:transcriptional regulator with XRE-family HTH domain
MKPEQAKELGKLLRERREALGLSTRVLAQKVKVDQATVVRFEAGAIHAPHPDKLARIAHELGLSAVDVFARAEYAVPKDLPTLTPYLRAKYRELRTEDIAKIASYVEELAKARELDLSGPSEGEDEK